MPEIDYLKRERSERNNSEKGKIRVAN